MVKSIPPLSNTLLLGLCTLLSAAAFAQDPVVLEIEQDGEIILEIPLVPSEPVDIDGVTGWLRATATSEFSCTSGPGDCNDVRVSLEAVDSGSFSVSPTTVAAGANVALTWASKGAWECEGVGLPGTNWATGVKNPSGSQNVTMAVDPGTYEASIRCFNGPVEAVAGPLSVVVVESGPPDPEIPAFCQGRQPPGMTATVNCVPGSSLDCRNYSDPYRAAFPGLRQAQQIFANRDQYIAMRFTVPQNISTSATGSWQWVVPQGVPSFTGRNLQTISRCPGDFDQDLIFSEMGSGCYLKQGPLPPITVQWAIQGGANSSSACQLVPGETYYFNILYTNSPAGTPVNELNWHCGNYDPQPNQCSHNTSPNF